MRSPSWWCVTWPPLEDAEIEGFLYREFKRLLPGIEGQIFRILEPEVWGAGQVRWTPENAYHGRGVELFETFSLIGSMVRQEGFWCRLDSGEYQIHVGEDCLYLFGTFAPDSLLGPNLCLAGVDSSPYQLETQGNSYRSADDSYWMDIEHRFLDTARLVFLSSWAAGTGGEIWFIAESVEDVREVRSILPAPSLLVVFEEAWLESIDLALIQDSKIRDYEDRPYGDVRLLRSSGSVRVLAENPANEVDLRNLISKGMPERMFLLTWPDSDAPGVTFAAYGDSASQLPPFG